MKTFELKGTLRNDLGKKVSKAERESGSIPCVLYGGKENLHFTATVSDLRKLVYSPEVFVVALDIDGKKFNSILKDLQFHPVSDAVLHIDFLEINETKAVEVEIPVKLEGLAEGVKAGGKLSLEMRKLKVKGIYKNIPENIVVNVTSLGLGKSVQVAKLKEENLEFLNAKNAVVAQVKLTRAARGAAAAAATKK